MDAQMDPTVKRGRAHYVLDNDGSLDDLRVRALELLLHLRADATRSAETPEAAETPEVAATPEVAPAPGAGPASDLLRIDLHLHTWGSWDCLSDPEEVLARALARGVDRIAITDHDRLGVALDMAERHPDRVIPGEEVRTAEGFDLIGLYLTEEIPARTPARGVCEEVRRQGGVLYLPHPYASGKGGSGRFAEEMAPLVDVVETFNARLHPAARNDPAVDLAHRHGRLRGAGSDAHTVGEVGGAWVEVPGHANEPGALLEALARGRTRGNEANRAVHLASTWAKVRKLLPGAPGRSR
jgi:hypothetical protein